MDIFGDIRRIRGEFKKHIALSHDPAILNAIDFVIDSLIKLKEDSDSKHEEILAGLLSLGAKVQSVSEFTQNVISTPQFIKSEDKPLLSETYYDQDSLYIPDMHFGESTIKTKDTKRDVDENDLTNDIASLSKLLGGRKK